MSWLPSTAGSLALQSSLTIWLAPVPLLSVNTGVVVGFATDMSVLAEETLVTEPVPFAPLYTWKVVVVASVYVIV